MATRKDLLTSIATTIADYRAGEISKPTASHVREWVDQFDKAVQLPILSELGHVLEKTYLSKDSVEEFLSTIVADEKFTDGDPSSYWSSVDLLNIQGAGNSQREMLKMLDTALESGCNLNLRDCKGTSGTFIYLDDGIYTGNRILRDLTSWIKSDAPDGAFLNVVVIALHSQGWLYAKRNLNQAAKSVGKTINIKAWRGVELEDRPEFTYSSDVLRPTVIPDDESVRDYAESLQYSPIPRVSGSLGTRKIFSSEEGRHVLEQEFLKMGVRIRAMCPNLNEYQRPLGNSVLQTLGFGTLLVTFRNCPNNAPLALWAGDPWHPLFPRKTN